LEEREEQAANDVSHGMDTWTVILMLGVTAIWAALGGAMAWLVANAQRA
jgi:ABC-type Fe3+ transport system permease subunit